MNLQKKEVYKTNLIWDYKQLWKDYENSEYTGNWNFTKTRNEPERKFRKYKKKIKNGNKIFWVTQIFLGWSADGKQTIF
jgi:hypothetical protein